MYKVTEKLMLFLKKLKVVNIVVLFCFFVSVFLSFFSFLLVSGVVFLFYFC